mmetsp:Transcript_33430/g.77018  ORF Transcript_33430/g.77018 Transcript_33430/m.77018 type:complete len:206 (+) Transcript_33430:392-1009(+)
MLVCLIIQSHSPSTQGRQASCRPRAKLKLFLSENGGHVCLHEKRQCPQRSREEGHLHWLEQGSGVHAQENTGEQEGLDASRHGNLGVLVNVDSSDFSRQWSIRRHPRRMDKVIERKPNKDQDQKAKNGPTGRGLNVPWHFHHHRDLAEDFWGCSIVHGHVAAGQYQRLVHKNFKVAIPSARALRANGTEQETDHHDGQVHAQDIQ